MHGPQIFISYRRDDAAGYARAIYDELARQFGAHRIFIDVDDIAAGQAFDEVIRSAVGASQVLLVLIGKRWLGERAGAEPRIRQADDFVRMEVAAALARGMRVIPLLIDGANMPSETQLPDALQPLVRRNALELDNARFASDMQRLIGALHGALRPDIEDPDATSTPAATATAGRTLPWWWMAAAVVLLAIGVSLSQVVGSRKQPPSEPASSSAPAGLAASANAAASRADINGEWQADVTYDWPNSRYAERFAFSGAGRDLRGTASFVGLARGIFEGQLDSATPVTVSFVTRTRETGSGGEREVVHRYRGTLSGDEIRFSMQTEGGSSSGVPIEFVARRAAPRLR